MLAKLASAVQTAMDTVAPPASPFHDFLFRWNMIMKFYKSRRTSKTTAIETTSIPEHMTHLLTILSEEDHTNGETTGPCLEYLLQNQLLNLLVMLGITNIPPGMKQYTFVFMKKLITQIHQPIIAYVGVYEPIQRLIIQCRGMIASPTEWYEISFLCAVCAVIGKDPELNIMFNNQAYQGSTDLLEEVSSQTTRSVMSDPPSDAASGFEQNQEVESGIQSEAELNESLEHGKLDECKHKERPDIDMVATNKRFEELQLTKSKEQSSSLGMPQKVSLIDALLSYIHSADNRVSIKACEGIMVITSLPSDAFAQSVIKNTNLCMVLATRLHMLYDDIPLDLDPNDLDAVRVTWGFDLPSWSGSDEASASSYRQIIPFLIWFDFCNQLVQESHPVIGSSLAMKIRAEFLEPVFGIPLLESKLNELRTTALISKCLKMTTAPALLEEFVGWIIGDRLGPSQACLGECEVLKQLLENCFHEQDGVSLETLGLFEVLLEKPCEWTYQSLILAYLNDRSYCEATQLDPVSESWGEGAEEWELPTENLSTDFPPESAPTSRTMAPANIHRIINLFLSLLPTEFLSAADSDECGYEYYVQDVDKKYQEIVMQCRNYSWPTEATFPETSNPDSETRAEEKPFFEGPFLNMIFRRLLNLPYQPFEISLQVSGIVSKLALLPHPYLHEYLLNPTLPIRCDVTTVFRVLEVVAEELVTQIPKISNYKLLFRTTHAKLVKDGIPWRHGRNTVLESAIVLEEFSKELAAIAFVKYHHSS